MAHRTAEAEKWADEMRELTAECSALLGRDFTAYVSGASHTWQLRDWADAPDDEALMARNRLETARRIALLMEPRIGNRRTVAWLRDPDPALGDISPADALRRSTAAEVHGLLLSEAQRYLSERDDWAAAHETGVAAQENSAAAQENWAAAQENWAAAQENWAAQENGAVPPR
jgi:hypothetical protein